MVGYLAVLLYYWIVVVNNKKYKYIVAIHFTDIGITI